MTSSFKDEKWYWLKGGLLLLLGCLGSAALILQDPAPKTLVLLIVIIWAFCRAYHHAFYVTEHYVDPGFKYMGLASFWDYLVDRSQRAELSERPLRYSQDDTARENYQIKTLILNWIAIGILGSFFLPTAYSDFMRYIIRLPSGSWLSEMLYLVALGIADSYFAALAVFASLASWSIRFRVPVALTLLAIFCSSMFVGTQDSGTSGVIWSFILPVAVFVFTFAMSCFARAFLGWRLVPRSTLGAASDKPTPGSQWGIAYLFLLSALVAIGVSLVSSLLPPGTGVELRSAFTPFEMLLGTAHFTEVAMVANAAVFLLFASRLTLPGKWTLVGSLIVLLLGPMMLPLLISSATGNFVSITSTIQQSYGFQLGLLFGLTILFVSARFANVRLLDRSS